MPHVGWFDVSSYDASGDVDSAVRASYRETTRDEFRFGALRHHSTLSQITKVVTAFLTEMAMRRHAYYMHKL
jgi:hypothetical protein